MSFISWQYALFLPLVTALHWLFGGRSRMFLLLLASYYFYAQWDPRFITLLLVSTCIDFHCGLGIVGVRHPIRKIFANAILPLCWLMVYPWIFPNSAASPNWIYFVAGGFAFLFTGVCHWIYKAEHGKAAKRFLWLSVFTNLGVLGFFKYFNFFVESGIALAGGIGWKMEWHPLQVILPVAISFYTFQSICYSVDIYKGKVGPIVDFTTFSAYLAFFPQLVAGPIERPSHLIPQFLKERKWVPDHLHTGVRLLLAGLFKKVFVADNCGILAGYAFDPKTSLNGWWALLGSVAFGFQIYGDFSGYTDIARGSARLLGIELSSNFRFPLLARDPSDFWRRWHISLSTWFRDYVYIPMGGNRGSAWFTARNLFITMLIAGLWHGASWNFVLWGGYHGVLLAIWHLALRKEPGRSGAYGTSGGSVLGIPVMFLLVTFGWILFRCKDLAHVIQFLGAFGQWGSGNLEFAAKPWLWLAMHAIPLCLLQVYLRSETDELGDMKCAVPVRGLVYAVIFMAVATSAINDMEFIYFQF